MKRKLTSKDKLIHASDFKCVECGEQAEVFFPAMDPDIPSYPYCKKCHRFVSLTVAWVYHAAGLIELTVTTFFPTDVGIIGCTGTAVTASHKCNRK